MSSGLISSTCTPMQSARGESPMRFAASSTSTNRMSWSECITWLGENSSGGMRTTVPGSYRVWAEVPGFGGLTELMSSEFVVQLDAAESDLSRSNPAAKGIKSDDEGLFTPVKGKLPMWSHFLFASFIFLLIETFIAGAGLRRSHVAK